MSVSVPKLAIGMPVYNAGKTLTTVLDSILAQDFTDFTLFISDNGSIDETQAICRQYAARDKRVVYHRQPHNIGAEGNFDFVLSNTQSEYFMWAAADDIRSPNYLSVNINFLEKNPAYLGSTSPTRFEDGEFDPVAMGDESRAEDDPFERVKKFFGVWHANGRFYSVFRRSAIEQWRNSDSFFLAADWLFVIYLLRQGKLNRAEQGYVVLGRDGLSNNLGIFARYRTKWLNWVLPFSALTVATLRTLKGAPFSTTCDVCCHLLKLNMTAAKSQLIFEIKKRRV